MKNKKMSKGKIVLIAVIAFFAIGVISGIIHNLTGTTPEHSAKNEDTSETTTTAQKSEQSSEEIIVEDFLTTPKFTAEKRTTEMVDQIESVAKENAKDMSEEDAEKIIAAIRDADHKFYKTDQDMEKFMWYGYLLEYKYDEADPKSLLGMDLCQAIKYVYRNADLVTDDSTHENLQQVDDDLERIE